MNKMSSSKSHPCKSCSYSAGSQRMLARHVAMAHSSTVYRCPLCPFVSCYKANFYRHKRGIHGLRQSYCELCNFVAPSVDGLAEHQAAVHPDAVGKPRESVSIAVAADVSNQTSEPQVQQGSTTDLLEVVKIENSPEVIDVDVEFDETLTQLVEVQSDNACTVDKTPAPAMELVPLKVRRQYTCTCGLKTTNPREFLAHRRDDHGENLNIFECKFCIYATKNMQKLYRHCSLVHKQRKEQVSVESSKKPAPAKRNKLSKTQPQFSNSNEQCNVKMNLKPPTHSQQSYPSFGNKTSSHFSGASQVQQLNNDMSMTQQFPEEYGERTQPTKKSSTEKFKCRNCSFSSKSKLLLMQHEKTVHLRKKFYRCQLCGYVCHEKGRYTKHVKYHSLPKTKCEFCDFETPYKWNLDRHLKSHELGGQFQCDKCSFTAHNRQSITVHLANHHANSNSSDAKNPKEELSPSMGEQLDDTNHSFQDDEDNDNDDGDKDPDHEELDDSLPQGGEPDEEDDEVILEEGEEEFVEEYSDDPDAQDWENEYSFENEEPYRKILKCSFCSFKTIWPQALNRHEAAHKIKKKYPCHYCVSTFDSIAWLSRHLAQRHRQNVHPKNLSKMFGTKRKKMFKPPAGHMMVKQGNMQRQKRFQEMQYMNKRSYASEQSSGLYGNPKVSRTKVTQEGTDFSHELVFVRPVGGGKPVNVCRLCGYKTRWVSEMEKHLRVHSDEKPFSCPCCMYRCKWKGDLKRHIYKYHGEHALSLIQETEMESVQQSRMNETPWVQKQRFKPASGSSQFRNTEPEAFFNGAKNSRWRRVPLSKRSNAAIKLSKLSDQDSPLDLTTPRRSDFEDSNSDIQEVSNEEDDTLYDDEQYNAEWPMDEMDENFPVSKYKQKAPPAHSIAPDSDINTVGKTHLYSKKRDTLPKLDKQRPSGSGFIAKRYKCTYCPFMSKTASRFHVHIIQHLNKKPFMCSACGYKSNWEWDITKHIKIKGMRDETHVNAQLHITDDSGFKNYEKYNRYLIDIGENQEENLPPDITSPPQAVTPTSDAVDNMVVMPDILGSGEQSDMLPTDMMETEFSICDQGSGTHPRIFKCKHCNFTNNEKKAVIGHLGVHAGLKPYRCKLCGMMSNWKHVIIRHVKLRHGGEMNYVEDRISYVQEGDTIKLSGVHVEGKSMATVQKTDSSRTVFPCSLCPYTCEKHYYMQFHMKQHKPRPEANMKCPLCPYWVKFKKTLTKHMKLHELPAYVPYQTPDEEVVQTKEPGEFNEKEGNDSSMLKNATYDQGAELLFETPKKPKRHKCDVCPYATNNMTQMLYHKQFHRQNKNAPFKCNTCSYWSTHNHLIIQHMKLHVNENAQHGVCEGPLNSMYSVNHENTGNSVKKLKLDQSTSEMYFEPEAEYKYSCTMCSYQCTDQRSLSTHYKFHQVVNTEFMHPGHSSTDFPKAVAKPRGFTYFCKDCPAMFKSRSDYNTHIAFHGSNLPFPCPHCNYKAKHKPHLHKHLHVHSDAYVARREASSYPLSLGSKEFTPSNTDETKSNEPVFQGASNEKLTIRLGVKQLKCTACPAVFYKQSTFQYHKSLHDGSGEQKCAMCTYAVNSIASLNKHLELHHKQLTTERRNSVKIFNCPICPAFFTKQARYEKHTSLHGQKNRYTCEHCNYSVKFAANLIKHRVVHNGPSPSKSPVLSPEKPPPGQTSPVVNDVGLVSPLPLPTIPKTVSIKTEVKEDKTKVWYSCSRCPYSQTRKDAVHSHLRRHGIVDGMSCPHCDYCTLQTSFLRDHIKRHFQSTPYLKIEAFMKCGAMEIWELDGQEQELIFRVSEENDDRNRFYPMYDDDDQNRTNLSTNEGQQQDDQLQPSNSVSSEMIDESATNNENNLEQKKEQVPCVIVPSDINGLVNETVKQKLIKDALRKTKTLEIVLTDVLHERKNIRKSSSSEGNFKIPGLDYIDVDENTWTEKPNHKTSGESNVADQTERTEFACAETNVEDNTDNYYEVIAEYSEGSLQDVNMLVTGEEENFHWNNKGNDEEMLMDIMISGDVYSEQTENIEDGIAIEDISDKDSDDTLPMEETLMEEVSDENLNSEVAKTVTVESSLPLEDPLIEDISVDSNESEISEKDNFSLTIPVDDSVVEEIIVHSSTPEKDNSLSSVVTDDCLLQDTIVEVSESSHPIQDPMLIEVTVEST